VDITASRYNSQNRSNEVDELNFAARRYCHRLPREKRQALNLPNHDPHERLTLAFRQSPTSLTDSQSEISFPSHPRKLWNSTRIAMKSNGTILLIDPTEILTAEAQGNYVLVFSQQGRTSVARADFQSCKQIAPLRIDSHSSFYFGECRARRKHNAFSHRRVSPAYQRRQRI
jgi:DNA-binding LytR/AlgR family response regulator